MPLKYFIYRYPLPVAGLLCTLASCLMPAPATAHGAHVANHASGLPDPSARPTIQAPTNAADLMEPQATIDRAIRAAWIRFGELSAKGEIRGRTVAVFPIIYNGQRDSIVGLGGEQIARRIRELAPEGVVCVSDDALRKRLDSNLLGTASYVSIDDLSVLAQELQVGFAFGGVMDTVSDTDVVGDTNFKLRIVGVRPFEPLPAVDESCGPVSGRGNAPLGHRIRAFCVAASQPSRIPWGSDSKATRPSSDSAKANYLATIVSQVVVDFVEANRAALAPDASGLPLGVAPSLQLTADGEKNTAFSNLIEKAFAGSDLRLGSVADPRKLVKSAEDACTQLRFFVDDDPSPSVLRALKVRGIVFADYDYQEWVQRLSVKLRFVGLRESLTYTIDISTQRTAEQIARALEQAGIVQREAASVDGELMLLGALKRTTTQLIEDNAKLIVDRPVRIAPVLTPATAMWENVLDWYRNALLSERERVLKAALEAWKGAKEPEEALADPAFPVQLATGQTYSCWAEAQLAVLLEANSAFSATEEQSAATKWKELVEKDLLVSAPSTKLSGANADRSQLERLMGDVHAPGGAKVRSWREVQPGYLIQLKVTPIGTTFVEVSATLIDLRKPLEEAPTKIERLPKAVNASIAKALEHSSFPEEALLCRFLGRNFTKAELAGFVK